MSFALEEIDTLSATVNPSELRPAFEVALRAMRGVVVRDVARTEALLDPHRRRFCVPIAKYAAVEKLAAEHATALEVRVPESVLDTLRNYVQKEAHRAATREEIRTGLDDILPAMMCEKLMEFQWEGIHFALQRDGRALIGDDMGLGKTLQTIAVARIYRGDWPLLIVCPSSLRLNWREELLNWLGEDIDAGDINVIMKGADCKRRLKAVNIASYDLAQKVPSRELDRCHFVVCDESHYLKSRDTKRSTFLLPLVKRARRALLLSGTPALSRPVELFPQVNALEPDLFPNYGAFTERYCDAKLGRWGWDVSGSANLDELYKIMRGSCLIRRKKEDVLTQLPSKQRAVVWVETKASVMRAVAAAQAELLAAGEALERAQSEQDARLCQNAQRSANNKLYSLTGDAKVDAVQVYLKETLESTDGKVLVFCHHKEVLRAIDEYVRGKIKTRTIVIDGLTRQESRQGLCKEFQTDPAIRVAVLSITAAGVGLTLTAASMVLFAELYWNPGSLLQAEDRAHRIGQRDCVMVKYLLARDTLDEGMWKTVKSKLTVVGRSLTGKAAQMEVDGDSVQRQAAGGKNSIARYLGGRAAAKVVDGDDDDGKGDDAGAAGHFANAGPGQALGSGSGGGDGRPGRYGRPGVVAPGEADATDTIVLDVDDDVFPVSPDRGRAASSHPALHLDADLALARRLQAEFDAEADAAAR
jgi:SWI/SNF-related matrix-associated actin-dependent regulator of chromatin subfamily A-like protein 1